MFKQVSAFLTQNNLLDSNQSGSEVDIQPRLPCSQLLKPCKSGFQIFNTLISFWIYPLLLTWLTTRSSCQPYWQRASQEPHSSGLSLTSQIGPSKYLGEVRYPSHPTSSYRGATGLSSWTTSLLCLHDITRFCHSETWLFISLLCWWHSTLLLIPSWWSDDSCSHLSLSNRHFLLDEGPSPSTQPS